MRSGEHNNGRPSTLLRWVEMDIGLTDKSYKLSQVVLEEDVRVDGGVYTWRSLNDSFKFNARQSKSITNKT